MILLFHKICIYDKVTNVTTIYGQYNVNMNHIHVNINTDYKVEFCKYRADFYIKINGEIDKIPSIFFYFNNIEIHKLKNIELSFPFENCNILLNKNTSAIISTFCKKYSHRLEEWIQYNLKLGFSGIIVFNNDENTSNDINEPIDNCVMTNSIYDICNKYQDKVLIVNCPYAPLPNNHYDTIQRIMLHIGVNVFRNKCRNIALIDADEFIYIPNDTMNIESFLNKYNYTITMKSNILTNKHDNDMINNNVLQLALYIGEDKYTKTILYTNSITDHEFIITPHKHPTELILPKDIIIHYHCWINKRYTYIESMDKISSLINFYNS
jgi:hypothetical protein